MNGDDDGCLRMRAAAAVVRRRGLTAAMLRGRLCRLRACLLQAARGGHAVDNSIIAIHLDANQDNDNTAVQTRIAAARYDALSEVLQLSALVSATRRKRLTTSILTGNTMVPGPVRRSQQKQLDWDWVFDTSRNIPLELAQAPVEDTFMKVFAAADNTFPTFCNVDNNNSTHKSKPDAMRLVKVESHHHTEQDQQTSSLSTKEELNASFPVTDLPPPTESASEPHQTRTFYRSSVIDERRAPAAPWQEIPHIRLHGHNVPALDGPRFSPRPVSATSDREEDSFQDTIFQSSSLKAEETKQTRQSFSSSPVPHLGYGMFRVEAVETYIGQRRFPAEPLIRETLDFGVHASTYASLPTHGRTKNIDHATLLEKPARLAFFQPDVEALQSIRLKEFVFEIGADGRIRRQREVV